MILNQYNQIINEFFDLSDKKTRKVIVALEDAQQDQLLTALAGALYTKIVDKADKINFGTIPKSRGDITKVDGFQNTVECLNIIRAMVLEYKEKTDIVDTVITAIENVKLLKPLFMKSFSLNAEFGMVLYNLIVMAIEQSVSFLIAVTIQYIKDPSSQSYDSALDKAAYNNIKDNMLYEQLYGFNVSCANGDIKSTLEEVLKNGGKITESIEMTATPEEAPNEEEPEENTVVVVKAEEVPEETESDKEVEDDIGTDEITPDMQKEAPTTEEPQKDIDEELDPVETTDDDSAETNEEPEESDPSPTMAVNGGTEIESGEESEQAVEETIAGAVKGIAQFTREVIRIPFTVLAIIFKTFIPLMRNITYFVMNSVVSFSDALNVQAQFIEMNAYNLQYSTNSDLDEDKKKKVVEKQLKIAAKLKSIASKFAIDGKKAKKDAEKMIAEDNKKNKIDDIDNLPDGIGGDLF